MLRTGTPNLSGLSVQLQFDTNTIAQVALAALRIGTKLPRYQTASEQTRRAPVRAYLRFLLTAYPDHTDRCTMTTAMIIDAIWLGLIWTAYFCIHSLQASLPVKNMINRKFPMFMPYYRLMFNLVATALLIPPLWLLYTGDKIVLWNFTGALFWITQGLALAAVFGFLISTRYYDGREFLGLRQLTSHATGITNQENLCLSPFHRYVRHPWYSFALILIWTRPMDSLMLTSASIITLYLIIGSRLEENKLLTYYGNVYARYISMVPGLIPLPWKYLRTQDVDTLIKEYRSTRPSS